MYGTLRKAALQSDVRHKAAIVIQRIHRARRKNRTNDKGSSGNSGNSGKLVIEAPKSFINKLIDATNFDDDNERCHGHSKKQQLRDRLTNDTVLWGYCPILHSTSVLMAIRDFSMARNKILFNKMNDSNIDIVDINCAVDKLKMQVDDVCLRIDNVERGLAAMHRDIKRLLGENPDESNLRRRRIHTVNN